MKKINSILITTAFFAMTLLFSACSKKSSDTVTTPPATGSTVSISNFAFVSGSLNITSGTTVTWTNNDSAPHTVTADDNSFTSPNLNKGDTYSHTFKTAGTIPYHCAVHPMMKATVIVK